MTEDVLGVENVTYVVDNRTEEGDIWMTQAAIAVILGTTQQNVAKHLKKKFESGELSEEENKVDPNLTNNFCKLKINTRTDNQPFLYNFDALMSVVYSVNSKQAISIRKWSNQVLKRFSTTGLVVDSEKALEDDKKIEEFTYTIFVKIIHSTIYLKDFSTSTTKILKAHLHFCNLCHNCYLITSLHMYRFAKIKNVTMFRRSYFRQELLLLRHAYCKKILQEIKFLSATLDVHFSYAKGIFGTAKMTLSLKFE